MDRAGNSLKVILIRHGESEANIRWRAIKDRIVHRRRIMPLREALKVLGKKYRDCSITDRGETMADNVCEKIKNSHNPLFGKIDQFWHSNLQRTRQTLERVFPTSTNDFMEMDFLHEIAFREFLFRRPFNKRMNRFRQELCNLNDDVKTVVVVGHDYYFRKFLKVRRKIRNVEVIVCDVDRKTGLVTNHETEFVPDVLGLGKETKIY